MAKVKVRYAKGWDISLGEFMDFLGDALLYGEGDRISSSEVRVAYDDTLSVMTGTNLNIGASPSGVVHDWDVFIGNAPVLSISNADFSVPALIRAVEAEGEGVDPFAFEKYFFDFSWNYRGTGAADIAPPGATTSDGYVVDFRGDDVFKLRGGNDSLGAGDGDGDDKGKGGGGKDKLWGEAGDDKLWGQGGKDKLWGGADDDRLDGGGGKDKLWGDAGDDALFGGGGKDKLIGGDGDDLLDGGKGKDKLKGGDGADVFLFDGKAGKDKILDWSDGEDLIRIDTGAESVSDLSIRDAGKGALVAWDDGKALLVGVSANDLGAEDFLFGA